MGDRGVSKTCSHNLNIEDLYFQVCPLAHDHTLWNNEFNGRILHSPHVDFLNLFIKKGKNTCLRRLFETKYALMYRYWDRVGYGLGGRNESYILRKANNLIDTFESIRRDGFEKKSRIQVLLVPLWISRGFDGGDNLKAPEIFHGHHRCASLFVLGQKEINVDVCVDNLPGSKKWTQKLDNIRNHLVI